MNDLHNRNGTITTSYVSDMLTELSSRRWYGTLEVKFEAGQIVLMRKTETIKQQPPSQLKRGDYEQTGR